MSNRTNDLPKLSGIKHLVREMRYHEFSRQSIGIILVSVFCFETSSNSIIPYASNFAISLILLGLATRMYASGFVLKNKELSTTGPYAFVRHPLYTGNIMILIGLCLINGFFWSFVTAFIFLWFYYPTAIEYEDRKLKSLFPDTWEEWASMTPALMPKMDLNGKIFSRLDLRSWSLKKSLVANYEPVIVVYVLVWVFIVLQR
ncbi:isoprenylcysteine carboxylmethyltransferase family protein [Gammaproteobacteria bacterium]|nr:isoprenylcysteine carboxylmethyltransferase family protein [Gammaproteobacteria bacterium]